MSYDGLPLLNLLSSIGQDGGDVRFDILKIIMKWILRRDLPSNSTLWTRRTKAALIYLMIVATWWLYINRLNNTTKSNFQVFNIFDEIIYMMTAFLPQDRWSFQMVIQICYKRLFGARCQLHSNNWTIVEYNVWLMCESGTADIGCFLRSLLGYGHHVFLDKYRYLDIKSPLNWVPVKNLIISLVIKPVVINTTVLFMRKIIINFIILRKKIGAILIRIRDIWFRMQRVKPAW